MTIGETVVFINCIVFKAASHGFSATYGFYFLLALRRIVAKAQFACAHIGRLLKMHQRRTLNRIQGDASLVFASPYMRILRKYYFLEWQEPPAGQSAHPHPQEDLPFFLSLTRPTIIKVTISASTRHIIMVARFCEIHEIIISVPFTWNYGVLHKLRCTFCINHFLYILHSHTSIVRFFFRFIF